MQKKLELEKKNELRDVNAEDIEKKCKVKHLMRKKLPIFHKNTISKI